jgi:hypothetical protein
MAYEHTEGKGSLFPNDYKTSDKHPDYRGKAKWNGEEIEISAWKGETQGGKEKLSIQIQKPHPKSETPRHETPRPPNRPVVASHPEDDDIPF